MTTSNPSPEVVQGYMPRKSPVVPGLKRTRWTRVRVAAAARFGWLWQPLLYAGLCLGFLLGRALPDSQTVPFGLAFFAAVKGAGFTRIGGLTVGVAVAAGAATVLQPLQVVWVVLALAVCHWAAVALKVGHRGAAPLSAAVLAGVCSWIPSALLVRSDNTEHLFFLSGLTAVLALVFTLGIVDTASGKVFHIGSADSPVPAIIILASALCGLDGLAIGPTLSLRDTAAALMVMICALLGGPPLGAAAGAVLGISFLFTGFGDQHLVWEVSAANGSLASLAHSMAYVVAGLLAGSFRELGRIGVGVAFCLGLVPVLMVSLRDPLDVVPILISAGIGMVLFWFLPQRLLSGVPAALVYTANLPPEPNNQPDPAPPHVVDRVRALSRVLREINRTFEQVAAVTAPADAGTGRIFEQVAERVCHSCSMYRECWTNRFDRTYQLYTDLWTQIDEQGPLTVQTQPEALEQLCIRPGQVASHLNHLYEEHRSRHTWERKLEEGRAVAGDYVLNVARLLDRMAEEVGRAPGAHRLEPTPVLRVVSGVARLPKRGSHISGDSYVGEPLSPDRYLLALSDGMGVGQGAATESRNTVKLLKEILGAGLTTDVAVRTVNSVLLLRSPEDSFATVDIALLDLATGEGEFVKVGAAPSFIKRGSDVAVVKTASVPVGIINQVQVEPEHRLLRPGELIIMITDGIWDISKDDTDKERWIIQHLARESSTDPEEVAESLLARALELMPDAGDDMTVLVARIDPIDGSKAPEVKRSPGDSWAAVRRAPRFRNARDPE